MGVKGSYRGVAWVTPNGPKDTIDDSLDSKLNEPDFSSKLRVGSRFKGSKQA